jgi:hypothetical protein
MTIQPWFGCQHAYLLLGHSLIISPYSVDTAVYSPNTPLRVSQISPRVA